MTSRACFGGTRDDSVLPRYRRHDPRTSSASASALRHALRQAASVPTSFIIDAHVVMPYGPARTKLLQSLLGIQTPATSAGSCT